MTEAIDHFDSAGLHATFNNWPCDRCGERGAIFIGPGAHLHYAAVTCMHCGKHHMWMPKPETPVKRDAKRSRRPPLPRIGQDYCWFCNRDMVTLASLGLKLERAHKRDRAALVAAGLEPDDPNEFMDLCTECHGFVDRIRLMVGRMTDLLTVAGALALPPTGIERQTTDAE